MAGNGTATHPVTGSVVTTLWLVIGTVFSRGMVMVILISVYIMMNIL